MDVSTTVECTLVLRSRPAFTDCHCHRPLLEDATFFGAQPGDVGILLSSAGERSNILSEHVLTLIRPDGTTALLCYDFLLTLSDEIRLVWQAPIRLATVLYLLVRYISLANMGLAVIIQTPETPVARLVTADVK